VEKSIWCQGYSWPNILWHHITNTTTCGIFPAVEPLAEVDPADRKNARAETPAAAAAAWLADPQPPSPPLSLNQHIAREIAEAIGWPTAKVEEAITQLHSYPGENSTPEETKE
jgi:hypothetical protein